MKVVHGLCDEIKTVCLEPHEVDALLATNDKSLRNNRRLNDGRVKKYADAMMSGHWIFTGADAIVVDSHGILRNGQTRLAAIKKAGYPEIPVLFVKLSQSVVGTDAQKKMDTQGARTYAQQLYLDGSMYSKDVASVRNVLACVFKGSFAYSSNDYEMDAIGTAYHQEICNLVPLNNSNNPCRLSAAPIAALCILAKRYGIHTIIEPSKRLVSNTGLVAGTSLHALNRLILTNRGKGRAHQEELLEKTFKAMRNHLNGVDVTWIHKESLEVIRNFMIATLKTDFNF